MQINHEDLILRKNMNNSKSYFNLNYAHYAKLLTEYFTILYKENTISETTYDFLLRQTYARLVESLMEKELKTDIQRLEHKLTQLILKSK